MPILLSDKQPESLKPGSQSTPWQEPLMFSTKSKDFSPPILVLLRHLIKSSSIKSVANITSETLRRRTQLKALLKWVNTASSSATMKRILSTLLEESNCCCLLPPWKLELNLSINSSLFHILMPLDQSREVSSYLRKIVKSSLLRIKMRTTFIIKNQACVNLVIKNSWWTRTTTTSTSWWPLPN